MFVCGKGVNTRSGPKSVCGKGVNTRSGPKSVCVCGKGGFLGVYRKVGGLKDVLIRINTSLNPPTFFNYN